MSGLRFIERSWRLLATALLFAAFGIGGMIVSVVIFPLILALRFRPESQRVCARWVVSRCFRTVVECMSLTRVCRFDIDRRGLDELARRGGSIIVCNHPSLIDVVVLLAYVDQASCVVKHTLLRNPCICVVMRAARYVSNENLDKLMQSCVEALQAGEVLIVFPEATRSVPGQPLRLKRGAANIAVRANAKLQLVHFHCEPALLPKNEPWYKVPETVPCLKVRTGVSLDSRQFAHSGVPFGVAARRLTDALSSHLIKGLTNDGHAGSGAQAASN